MLKPGAGRDPLHVTFPEPCCSPQGICMITISPGYNGNGFKTTVGMCRKTGYTLAVIHSPTIPNLKIISQAAALQGRVRTEVRIASWVSIQVVDAKQERIWGVPGEAQGKDGWGFCHGLVLKCYVSDLGSFAFAFKSGFFWPQPTNPTFQASTFKSSFFMAAVAKRFVGGGATSTKGRIAFQGPGFPGTFKMDIALDH